MFQHILPEAATSKSPAQPEWPVHVDHCFARIILDKIVGVDVPWMQKIKSPAYKHMSVQQLQDSIALGQQILDGEVDLVELDNMSLEVRGKGKRKSGKVSGKVTKEMGTTKRKAQNLDKVVIVRGKGLRRGSRQIMMRKSRRNPHISPRPSHTRANKTKGKISSLGSRRSRFQTRQLSRRRSLQLCVKSREGSIRHTVPSPTTLNHPLEQWVTH